MQLSGLADVILPQSCSQFLVQSSRAHSARAGSLGSAKKKRYMAGGRQAVRPFVYHSILEAVRLNPPEQRVHRRGSTGMPCSTPSMTSGVVVGGGLSVGE